MSDSTPQPYFPQDLDNYAPWVTKYGLFHPYGKCQCGCAQPVGIALETASKNGWRKDHPKRFINGHNGRHVEWCATPRLCECGCGQPAPIQKFTDPKRGYKRGQPSRFIVGHQNKLREYPDAIERFWSKVDKRSPDECWVWKASTAHGYGQLKVGERMILTHRFSWELHNGPITDGLFVCHNCPSGDNPLCVNPAHLFLGTSAENSADMVEKCRQKESRFTPEQVTEIRQCVADGMSQNGLAKALGIPRSTIHAIVKRKIWKHIP